MSAVCGHTIGGTPTYYVMEPCLHKRLFLNAKMMPGMGPEVYFRTSTEGIRGPALDDDADQRILAIGCSVAVSEFVDQQKTWSHLLQEALSKQSGGKIWTGVVGKGELTSRDMVTLMTHFVPQYRDHLDRLLVWVGVNDLALMLSKRGQYDPNFFERMGQDYALRRVFDRIIGVDDSYKSLLMEKTLLALRCAKSKLVAKKFERANAFLSEKRAARKQAKQKISSLPDIQVGLDEYGRNINKIIDLALSQSLPLTFMTIPTIWSNEKKDEIEELLWFGWIGKTGDYYDSPVLAIAACMYNQRLVNVCKKRSIDVLDLASLLPRGTSVFYDDVHLNENGSYQTAQLIGDFLAA